MTTLRGTRLTRRGWLVLAALPAGLLLLAGLWSARDPWQLVESQWPYRKWHHAGVTHIDTNGDGRVDEVSETDPRTGRTSVRRDTDQDGWLDVSYELGPLGIAMNLRRIREQAPRH
jgi:hypothetical protein